MYMYMHTSHQGDDVKALLRDAMPASLPPSVTPSTTEKDGSKANIAAIGLTAAGALLLTNEYIPNSGDGSDKPITKRRSKLIVIILKDPKVQGLRYCVEAPSTLYFL